MSNQVVSLAIIGKNNQPLYLKEFVERNNQQHDHFDEGELFGLVAPKVATLQEESQTSSCSAAPIDETTTTESSHHDPTDTSEYTDDDDDIVVESQSILFKATRISLKQEFILHAALDNFEQLSGPPPGYAWRRAVGNTTGGDNHHPMYMGLLCPVEDLRVYGYMTTTQIKFFVVVVDDPTSSNVPHASSSSANSYDFRSGTTAASTTHSDAPALNIHSPSHHHHHHHPNMAPSDSHQHTDALMQRLFMALHQCYVSYMLNPFSPLMASSPIVSRFFDQQIQAVVTKHNRLCLGQKK